MPRVSALTQPRICPGLKEDYLRRIIRKFLKRELCAARTSNYLAGNVNIQFIPLDSITVQMR